MIQQQYSTVIVGTGFASSFFLHEYLSRARSDERILVLERGRRLDPAERLRKRLIRDNFIQFEDVVNNRTPQKPWIHNIGFGGTAAWMGHTVRMHPNDFRTRSLYGVGDDWPLSYSDLEPYYVLVEHAMSVAGASEGPYPRSKPYLFPAHRLNAFDKLLARKYPGLHLPLPSARASDPASGRPPCCGSGPCSLCPIGAKFEVAQHMAHIYDDPRVVLLLEAEAEFIDIQAGSAVGVQYRRDGKEQYAKSDLVAVGAHAIMTPFILLRSGLRDHALGRYLNEQLGPDVQIDLDGIDNFGGGQAVSGMGTMFLDGTFRGHQPGCLIESWNVPWLRAGRGRWRQRAFIKLVFEDIPSIDNYVGIAREDPTKPEIHYPKLSDYLKRGIDSSERIVKELVKGLPVESINIIPAEDLGSSAHIQGTTRMGIDPKTSVVDRDLRHHSVRNLVVLGSGTFPTCPAANPTLTLSALGMRAAHRLFS